MSTSDYRPNKLELTLDGIDESSALSILSARYQDILRKRYGLSPYDRPYAQTKIANEMKVTYQRIGQIEKKALGKLASFRELYRPERVFYREEYDLCLSEPGEWRTFPDRALGHETWEDVQGQTLPYR